MTSADEKNDPDIIPHDNSDDEKDFERLYTPTNLNYVNRHSPNSNSPTLRFGEKQVRMKLKVLCHGQFAVCVLLILSSSQQITLSFCSSFLRFVFRAVMQYGELSLTTNPGFALYNNPTIRKYNVVSSPTNINNPNSTTTTILRSKSPPNIYTRLPLKESYPSHVSLAPTPLSPKLMTSSIVGYGSQSLSPTKHLLVTTTPFIENGDLTTTATNLADKCILSSVRMPLLNVNYKAEINNRINNGIITNGSAMSQLSANKES
jgi:hypothetical protein